MPNENELNPFLGTPQIMKDLCTFMLLLVLQHLLIAFPVVTAHQLIDFAAVGGGKKKGRGQLGVCVCVSSANILVSNTGGIPTGVVQALAPTL